jgi:hypothetical protein
MANQKSHKGDGDERPWHPLGKIEGAKSAKTCRFAVLHIHGHVVES